MKMPPIDLDMLKQDAAGMAARLRLLANPDRLVMLCKLGLEEQSVTDLVKLTGIAQSSVSQHLAVLREAGVVDRRRQAQTLYYRLVDHQIFSIIEALCAICHGPAEREAVWRS